VFVVESTNWEWVLARPLIEDIPANIKEKSLSRIDEGNKMTWDGWGPIWIPNLKRNLEIVKGDMDDFGVYQLANKHIGKTAIICGAGPSLEKNIDDLLQRDKFLVFADTHSLKTLLKHGITPDYVGIVDGKAVQQTAYMQGLYEQAKSAALLFDICSCPELLEQWKGRVYFFRSVSKGQDEIPRKLWEMSDMHHVIRAGGNVTTCLYTMALGMGIRRVVFVGCDLSNGARWDNVLTYAGGEIDDGRHAHVVEPEPFLDFMLDVDIQGLGVATLMRMYQYKFWLDYQSLNFRDVEHINATEAGILGAYPQGNLRSIKQMRLSDVKP
jgi:hypothetical protein